MTKQVKKTDKNSDPPLLEHVGWRLWRASQIWQERFVREMVERGYPWFREARAAVIPHIERAGTRQVDLTACLGLTKQAIQQLVDALVRDGVVERRPDPNDARGRIVCFTPNGLCVLADANVVKRQIEQEFKRAVTSAAFDRLNVELARMIESCSPDQNKN